MQIFESKAGGSHYTGVNKVGDSFSQIVKNMATHEGVGRVIFNSEAVAAFFVLRISKLQK